MLKYFAIGIIITAASFFLVSCSSEAEKVKPEKSWWGNAKCKFIKKNDACD